MADGPIILSFVRPEIALLKLGIIGLCLYSDFSS